MPVTLWSPDGLDDETPAPCCSCTTGRSTTSWPDSRGTCRRSRPTETCRRCAPRCSGPGHRDERYSADGAYTRALCLAVLPRLRSEVATTAVVGVGASLGALAMLHAQRQNVGCLDALFLQSGSFFHPRHDAHERRFERYQRIVRSVDAVLRADRHPAPVPTVMTCGTLEENLANNRIMARALSAQGYDVALREVRDVHNYTAWRDAFDPWLTGLLREVARRESPARRAAMTRSVELTSPASGWRGQVVAYGHWGAPVLVFPSEAGRAWDFENNGMVEAVALAAGRRPGEALLRRLGRRGDLVGHARCRSRSARARHDQYERWVLEQVVPFIHDDCGGLAPIVTLGCSLGAYHAANIALRHAHVFPRALCLSGSYDPSQWHAWGERGDAAYFHNPMDYVANLHGRPPRLAALARPPGARRRAGRLGGRPDPGAAEHPPVRRGARGKGIPHELDVWGHDVPHDWPSWRASSPTTCRGSV